MGTTDKKYKFLINFENFDIKRKCYQLGYPVTYDEDDIKLKCTLKQAIQYAKDIIAEEKYALALIMSYNPHDCSYNSGIASVSTIPLYFEKTADKLMLNIRKQDDFIYLKENYNKLYTFIMEVYDTFTPRSIDEFTEELEFDDGISTITFYDTKFFVCERKFTDYTEAEKVKIIHDVQKQVVEATGVHGLEDFEPRVYKYEKWKECLFDYDETDPQHCDNDEIEL